MPWRSKAVCSEPGCNTLTRHGKCEKHARRPDPRPSASERGYDARWHRLRAAYVAQHPVCEIREKCNGDPVAEVDHIIPISRARHLRLDWDNLQSACKACHAWKTAEDQRKQAERAPST